MKKPHQLRQHAHKSRAIANHAQTNSSSKNKNIHLAQNTNPQITLSPAPIPPKVTQSELLPQLPKIESKKVPLPDVSKISKFKPDSDPLFKNAHNMKLEIEELVATGQLDEAKNSINKLETYALYLDREDIIELLDLLIESGLQTEGLTLMEVHHEKLNRHNKMDNIRDVVDKLMEKATTVITTDPSSAVDFYISILEWLEKNPYELNLVGESAGFENKFTKYREKIRQTICINLIQAIDNQIDKVILEEKPNDLALAMDLIGIIEQKLSEYSFLKQNIVLSKIEVSAQNPQKEAYYLDAFEEKKLRVLQYDKPEKMLTPFHDLIGTFQLVLDKRNAQLALLLEIYKGESGALAEYQTGPTAQKPFDARSLEHRADYWKIRYLQSLKESNQKSAMSTVLKEMNQFTIAFTRHAFYDISDDLSGDLVFGDSIPRTLEGSSLHDCGVYAMRAAYEISQMPVTDINFYLIHMPNHVGLAIVHTNREYGWVIHNNMLKELGKGTLNKYTDATSSIAKAAAKEQKNFLAPLELVPLRDISSKKKIREDFLSTGSVFTPTLESLSATEKQLLKQDMERRYHELYYETSQAHPKMIEVKIKLENAVSNKDQERLKILKVELNNERARYHDISLQGAELFEMIQKTRPGEPMINEIPYYLSWAYVLLRYFAYYLEPDSDAKGDRFIKNPILRKADQSYQGHPAPWNL